MTSPSFNLDNSAWAAGVGSPFFWGWMWPGSVVGREAGGVRAGVVMIDSDRSIDVEGGLEMGGGRGGASLGHRPSPPSRFPALLARRPSSELRAIAQ
ncbi:hypothetical protein ACHAW5_008602 [Stephanodiscus triporus]|uniref:Uncharacterized protein n=1 Tax=Stephanodiscus triporus TaxID=2934178 RepID=A0ABD3NC40_9STRA